VNDQLQLIILALFGLLILLLIQLRELMRQVSRTASEWRRMLRSLRAASGVKPLDRKTGAPSDPGKALRSAPDADKGSEEGSQSEF
jgi:hypothetical protein